MSNHELRRPEVVSDLTVWQACRATSAALQYFETSRKLPSRKSENGLVDAGALLANPTLEIFREVRALRGEAKTVKGVLLSVGVDRSRMVEPNSFRKRLLRSKQLREILLSLSRAADVDSQLKELEDNGKVENYFRLSVAPRSSDVGPKDMRDFDRLRRKFKVDEMLRDDSLTMKLKRCAEKLVEYRRSRSSTTRWETFALGSRYRCPDSNNCPTGKGQITYETRTDLLNHLLWDHKYNPPDSQHSVIVDDALDRGRFSPHPSL
jgi:hypothetical protein